MKKAILTSASIFALSMAGSALAQSAPSAPAGAVPTPAPATPDCSGTINNCSLIEQAGNDLNATVNQSGEGNTSDIDQINGSVGNPNNTTGVVVTQSGTDNQSYVLQDGTRSANFPSQVSVLQDGTGAESTVIQFDTGDHKVSVIQTGENDSFVYQDGPNIGGDSRAEVVQFGGDLNTSVVFQVNNAQSQVGNPGGLANGVTQNGNRNNSEVYQGDFSGGTNANRLIAQINQTGDDNNSYISQSNTVDAGGTFPNVTTGTRVNQSGDFNISSVVQTGARGGQPSGSFNIDIIQNGDSNLSRVEQNNVNSANSLASLVTVTQNSDENDSFIQQSSGSGDIAVTQTATGFSGAAFDNPISGGTDIVRANFSRVIQTGNGRTEATLTQTGFGNLSDIRQSSPNSPAGPASAATVTQTGQNQSSFVEQSGASDLAFVDQIGGAGNFSRVIQLSNGISNEANVEQRGDNGESTITQDGWDNTANLLQGELSDGNISEITQGGSFNMADVFQYSSGNSSTVTQSGSDNILTVTQGAAPPP